MGEQLPTHPRLEGHPHRVPSSPNAINPQDPPNKIFTHYPQIANWCWTSLIFVQHFLVEVIKLLQTALNTCIFLYFCINKGNLDVKGWFSFHFVFYESDICLRMVKNTNMSGKDRHALWTPQQSSGGWGHHPPPQHSQKLASMGECLYKRFNSI